MSTSVYDNSPQNVQKRIQEADRTGGAPLAPMYQRNQWTPWRRETRNGDTTKVLYNAQTGGRARTNDPDTWTNYADAYAAVAPGKYAGVGYVVSADDPFTVIDLDHCRDPQTGAIEPWAMEIIEAFGTYAEPSAGSGSGVHIIGYGKKIADRCRNWKHEHGTHIEIYERARFLTMSETPLPGFETIRAIQEPLDRFITEHWTKHQQPRTEAATPSVGVSLAVRDIIDLARSNPKFVALYDHGDTSGHGGDSSAADSALCCLVAWYTKDPAQILDVWKSSALKRDKTDRKDYTDRTIENALKVVGTSQYNPNYSANHRGLTLILPGHTPDATPDNVPDNLEDLRAELLQARAHRDAYKAAYEAECAENEAVAAIVRIADMDTSTRIAMIGVLYMGLEYQRKNQPQTEIGYHMPASWIGRKCGLKPQTVNRQLKRVSEAGLIDRQVIPVTQTRTVTMQDSATGETETDTYESRGQQSYITLPANVIDIVPRLTGYQKPADAPKRGGKRAPKCDKHPDSPLVKLSSYHCEACYHEAKKYHLPMPPVVTVDDPKSVARLDLEEGESVSDIKHESEYTPSYVSIGGIKHVSETDTNSGDHGHLSNLNRESDRTPLVPRCDYRIGPGETCDEPTEAWETGLEGYSNNHLCHTHAEIYRKNGARPPRTITTSRVLPEGVAS